MALFDILFSCHGGIFADFTVQGWFDLHAYLRLGLQGSFGMRVYIRLG